MWGQAAIRVDFMRWKRQDCTFCRSRSEAVERGQEEGDIRAGPLEIAVAGHDVEYDAVRPGLSSRRNEQRLRRLGEPRYGARRYIHAAARHGGLQDGTKVE